MLNTLLRGDLDEVRYLLDNKTIQEKELQAALMNAIHHIQILEAQVQILIQKSSRLANRVD